MRFDRARNFAVYAVCKPVELVDHGADHDRARHKDPFLALPWHCVQCSVSPCQLTLGQAAFIASNVCR